MFKNIIFLTLKIICKCCKVELQFKQMINILGIHNNNKQYSSYIIIFMSFMDRKHEKKTHFCDETEKNIKKLIKYSLEIWR